MLNTNMIVNKEVIKKVSKEYFFIKGTIDIDSEYFIKEIKRVCYDDSEKNLNFKTNIKGLMTKFDHFAKDQIFQKTIKNLVEFVDDNYSTFPFIITDAWGLEVRPGEKTLFHDHSNALWSGAIYLNSCNQPLEFPEINEELKPEKGSFAVFSSFLVHGCNKNKDTTSKFGLSFNAYERKRW